MSEMNSASVSEPRRGGMIIEEYVISVTQPRRGDITIDDEVFVVISPDRIRLNNKNYFNTESTAGSK